MDTMVLRIFQREVERQCKFALIAAEDLDKALRAQNADLVWFSIQALLVAAGDISKLLWPPNPRLSERGAELRASLSVSDDSPLQPRTFRNHWEHFDERLEMWATSSERHIFADSNIGPQNMISGLDPGDYLRNFDPENWIITFRGDKYELRPIVDAVVGLWKKSKIEAQKPWW